MSHKKKRRRCKEWRKEAVRVVSRYSALGFRHNAARAQGAEDVLNAMGLTAHRRDPHDISIVSGLTQVTETW